MPTRKARTATYYETTPDSEFSPGDIWSDLPSFGLLPSSTAGGIVITAACDLANTKTETVTYLPIIPLLQYFCLPAASPIILKRCVAQLRGAGYPAPNLPADRGFLPPRYSELQSAQEWLQQIEASGTHKCDAVRRAAAGISVLQRTWRMTPYSSAGLYEDLESLFGAKDFGDICEKLINNSYLPVLHFLPADNQPAEYSGVPRHSIALFRYPITLPAEFLYRANDVGYRDWKQGIQEFNPLYPALGKAFVTRPMKRSALRKPFVADLIARYVSLYSRIGAPSLAPVSVSAIVQQVKAGS